MAKIQLTQREHDVLRLVKRGLTNEEIADRLAISRRTVESHLRALFHKTRVTRRVQLMAFDRPDEVAEATVGRAEPASADDVSEGARRPGSAPADRGDQIRRYEAALRALTDRQFPLFEEHVEITATIGERNEQDHVVERRWTTPKPYLVYRILRPIVPRAAGQVLDLDELALACDMHGQDIQVDVLPVRDADGWPVVIALFQPGLQASTEWVLRYHSPGLWAPLRRRGEDTLTWATATLDRRHQPNVSGLTLKVIFPEGWTDERLDERGDLGHIEAERLPTGQRQLTWRHQTPIAPTYDWLVRGRSGR